MEGKELVKTTWDEIIPLLEKIMNGDSLTRKEKRWLSSVGEIRPDMSVQIRMQIDDRRNAYRAAAYLEPLVSSCPGLASLDLRFSDVTDISSLAGLTNLQGLYLINTGVTDISALAGLKNLARLSLSGTKVTEISALAGLGNLEALHLRNTGVTEISALAGLGNLEALYLSNTGVTDISALAGLDNLETLRLDNTGVTDISALAGLKNLMWLYLSGTGVTDISALTELKNLHELYLSDTGVIDISALAGLKNLRLLDLSNTGVTDISALAGLENLILLSLSGIRIPEIPRALVRRGLDLYLGNAVLDRQPAALFDLPTEVILKTYYDQEQIPVREGKVIFLGDSGVGKTHTIMRFKNNGIKQKYETDSTPGIDIIPCYCGDGEKTKINFWDFGGQEIMQSMHHCFLTERTCYVIVVSNREGMKVMPQITRWLRVVAGFKNKVSVIVAVNQWNNVQEENNVEDISKLREICPSVTDVVFYSAENDSKTAFITKLSKVIEKRAKELDSVKMMLPKSWAELRNKLSHLEEPYISLANYREKCGRHGLGGDDETMETIRMWLLEWFNDLGVCFSYHKDAKVSEAELADYKVLQPKWLTNGIYRIINNGLKYAEGGTLGKKDIEELLTKEGLLAVDPAIKYRKEQERNYILEVMRKFGRSYAVESEREFVPELLPGKSPEYAKPRNYDRHVTCRIELRYLPQSLIHRLMIDMWEWNGGVMWRSGVKLIDDDSELLAESHEEENYITLDLYCRGKSEYYPLFHSARLNILRYCREMSLVVEKQFIEARKNDSTAKYEVVTVLDACAEGEDHFGSSQGKYVRFSLDELIFPAFSKEIIECAELLKNWISAPLMDALDAVCTVYPYAPCETYELAEEEFPFSERDADEHFTGTIFKSLEQFDVIRLAFMALRSGERFIKWLEENGKKRRAAEEANDPGLGDKKVDGINRQLYNWALRSGLFKKAFGVRAGETYPKLKHALGPTETYRYQNSYDLMNMIWAAHPELGLGPEYKLLAESEYNREFHPKYREHMAHMFKVFMLGGYLYENRPDLKDAFKKKGYNEDSFLSVWILASLHHDIGYLIEKGDGDEKAKPVFEIINEAIKLPLTSLYPEAFPEGSEEQLKADQGRSPATIRTIVDLERKLDVFNGYGREVQLSEDPKCNPIKAYFNRILQVSSHRSYFDHGIVSAGRMLFAWDSVCNYIRSIDTSNLYDKKRECIDGFKSSIDRVTGYVKDAALAVALHNIKKDLGAGRIKTLYADGITISDFRIPLDKEPLAYLLRLCDELQCWDRQRFDCPIDTELYPTGDMLELKENGRKLKMEVRAERARESIKEGLKDIIDPSQEKIMPLE